MARAKNVALKKTKGNGSKAHPVEVAFDFLKSNLFRVIHVDGAFGGISPQGRTLHLAVFSERRPLPTKTVHPMAPDGTLGDELQEKRQSRTAFVREIEANLVMDFETAMSLHSWLGTRIEEWRSRVPKEKNKNA